MIVIGEVRLFSVKELAEKFDMHPVTIRRYLEAGIIQGKKLGRKWFVSEETLREYFKQWQQPARGKERETGNSATHKDGQ
jgi:excisionase family DNA binding protein